MANYEPFFRSNYFAVKDAEKFKAFCDRFSFDLVEKESEGGTLYGFVDRGEGEGGLPSMMEDESGDWVDVDFIAELAEQLTDTSYRFQSQASVSAWDPLQKRWNEIYSIPWALLKSKPGGYGDCQPRHFQEDRDKLVDAAKKIIYSGTV
jgi:hypothetical protein